MTKISEGQFTPAEQTQFNWFATAPAGTPREASLDAVFWTHVARKLRPLARVTVMPEDGAWYQELLCVVADGRDVRMKELGFWELEDTSDVNENRVSADLLVEWGGPKHLWRVTRIDDGVVMAKNLPSRADANHWVANNTRRAVA